MENESNNIFSYRYERSAMTSDCVVFGYDGQKLNLLLVKRGLNPFKGCYALPGGFLQVHDSGFDSVTDNRINETCEQCALRELNEETGLTVDASHIHQVGTYSTPDRDPRHRVVTVAFMALVKKSVVIGGDDAASAEWIPLENVLSMQLAFDHITIVKDAIEKLRRTIFFEPIGFDLLDEQFTMSELQRLYEQILGIEFDRRNFARKISTLGILEEVENQPQFPGRPTRWPFYYRFNKQKYDELKNSNSGVRFEF